MHFEDVYLLYHVKEIVEISYNYLKINKLFFIFPVLQLINFYMNHLL